jgi:hypothetical protein
MKGACLALFATAAIVGAIALAPVNAANGERLEEDRLEIPLSDWIPNLSFDLHGILGLALNLDLGNWLIDFEEMIISVEEFDVSAILTLMKLLDVDLTATTISKATLDPPALNMVAEVLSSFSIEGLRVALSLIPFSVFVEIENFYPIAALLSNTIGTYITMISIALALTIVGIPLAIIIYSIPQIISEIFDFPISALLKLDAEGATLGFNIVLRMLFGKIEIDPIPHLELVIPDLVFPPCLSR